MPGSIYWLIPLAALFYIGAIVNLVRQRRLSEAHALLWIVTFLMVAVSPFFVPFLDRLALFLGIYYSPTLYLMIAIFFLTSNLLSNTLEISKLTEQTRRLTQEVSILRRQIESGERPPHEEPKGD
jgi:hypothetical protein